MRAIMSSLIFITPSLKRNSVTKELFWFCFFFLILPCFAGNKITLSARDQEIKMTVLFLASLRKKKGNCISKILLLF